MNDLERIEHWQRATRRDYHPIENVDEYFASGRQYWIDKLSKQVSPSDSVLEYGCGDGRLARFVECRELYVVDVSIAAIQATLANVPHAKVYRFDKPVDLMFSANVFIHLTHSMIASTLYFMARYAKRFAIQMPIYEESREGCDWIDVTTATPVQWIQWCDEAGLDVVELRANRGAFDWEKIGPSHHELQILRSRYSG